MTIYSSAVALGKKEGLRNNEVSKTIWTFSRSIYSGQLIGLSAV
ncbi:hypothetical protein VDIAB_30134 [Vibrio diabolicus]|nr:hypothetical protein VDIAB_30134 [Vibrio diabolicus]